MKKYLLIILSLLLIVTGCAKKTTSPKLEIMEHCKAIFQTEDTSIIRNELSELEKLTNDPSLNEEEKMFAQYTYNISYGAAKLGLSSKSISVFDFPEMEMLFATVGAISREESNIDSTKLEESVDFLKKVEEFLK